MKKRLSLLEKRAVRQALRDNIVYKAIFAPSLQLEKDLNSISLSPEEFLWAVFAILDDVKEDPDCVEFYVESTMNDTYTMIRNLCQNGNEEHINEVAASIVGCCAMLLNLYDGEDNYTSIHTKLLFSIAESNCDFKKVINLFYPSFVKTGDSEIKSWISQYMDSEDEWVTDTIGNMLEEDVISHQEIKPSNIRIANGKKTSVLVVLNSMFKSGWFVDKDGKKLKNRDDALNEIIKHAFCEDKTTHISQTIKPTNSTDPDRKNKMIISRLLNEQDMTTFINDLIMELSANVK